MIYIACALIWVALLIFPILENSEERSSLKDIFPTSSVEVLFLGDMMFDRDIRNISHKKGYEYIFQPILKDFKKSDLIIGNLEGPITDNQSVSLGSIPESPENYRFTFDALVAKSLSSVGKFALSIGNNHIRDFGEEGVLTTKKVLKENNIPFFGDPLSPLGEPLFVNIKGKSLALINYNEFSNQTLEETLSYINSSKGLVDYVFVYTHWGNEYEKTPREDLRNLAHKFIDAGADAVFGSHPHVIGEIEEYKGKKIYYSLGNFIFDQYWDKSVTCGLIVYVEIEETLKFKEENWGFNRKRGQVEPCVLE